MLGHEIIHITEQHTIRAIQKSKSIQMGADETLSGNAALFNSLVDNVYLSILDNSFGRAEENESDEKGVALANRLGYAPQGLSGFSDSAAGAQQGRHRKARAVCVAPGDEGAARSPGQADRAAEAGRESDSGRSLSARTSPTRRCPRPALRSSKPVRLASPAAAPPRPKRSRREAKKPEEKKEEPAAQKRGFGALGRVLPGGGGGEKKSAQVSAAQRPGESIPSATPRAARIPSRCGQRSPPPMSRRSRRKAG